MTGKKKVLVFNGYYLPAKNYGGPTTSLANIVKYCSKEFEFYIIAANHDLNDSAIFEGISDGWNKVGDANVLYIDTRLLRKNVSAVEKMLKDIKPDLVWLVGILKPNHWMQAKACRNLKIPYIISPRGEVCENTFHMKYIKKRLTAEYVKLMRIYKDAYYHATSEEELEGLVKYYNAPKSRISLVPNIPKEIKAESHSIEKQIGNLRIVYISRIQEKKNLLTAIKAVDKLDGQVVFDIYGPIESEEYWQQCQNEIENTEKRQIKYCGQLKPEEVAEEYRNYHVFLFPTISENYGHAIAEALSMSCPVVLSKGTTPWDDLNNRGGYICELMDVDQYTSRLHQIQNMDQTDYDNLMRETALYYNEKMMLDDSITGHIEMIKKAME